MKSKILILCLVILLPFAVQAQKYKHKTEAEIAALTPAQRVDEWVNEQVYHLKFWYKDDHDRIIRKYLMPDGIKAMPRLAEIIDEYDPTRYPEDKGNRGERFESCVGMLSDIDNLVVRIRSAEDGRKAIDALERSVQKMRKAGYAQKLRSDNDGLLDRLLSAEGALKELRGINSADESIKDTLRLAYKIMLSDDDLLALSNFMTARYADYPGWSKKISFDEYTRFNEAGSPKGAETMRQPERFYEAYLEFKKAEEKR